MMRSNLLGIEINYPFKKSDFESILISGLSTREKKFIFTINPEFIVDTQKDSYFKNVLNKGYFNSADGIGVVMALEYNELRERHFSFFGAGFNLFRNLLKGKLIKKRFTGVEISEKIFEFADRNYLSIFLLGGDGKKLVSERLLEILEKRYPNINFIGSSSMFSSKPNDDISTIDYINNCMDGKKVREIDFILVAYGHPFQEKWIDRNAEKINSRFFIGVGGTFDFLTGEINRAPSILQSLGLEWLFRLLKQPKRFKRILKAVVGFTYLFFTKNKQF